MQMNTSKGSGQGSAKPSGMDLFGGLSLNKPTTTPAT
jgi:hypothetical protein